MAEPAATMSYREYVAFERESDVRHDFIDGLVVAMAGGTLEHARLCAKLTQLLGNALETKRCRVFSADGRVRVRITNRSAYPDVTVVCGEVERSPDDDEAITNPAVIVEVLSDSSELSDRGEKFAHYRRLPSLQEYVLVSQDEPRLEVFRRSPEGWLLSEAGPGEHAALPSIGATLDVDALYRDTLR